MARSAPLSTVTEADAYREYEAHVRDCPPCRAAGYARCGSGIRFHDHWRKMVDSEAFSDAQARRAKARPLAVVA